MQRLVLARAPTWARRRTCLAVPGEDAPAAAAIRPNVRYGRVSSDRASAIARRHPPARSGVSDSP